VNDWAQESWALAHDLVYPQVFGHVVAATETTPKEVTLDDKSLDKDAAVAGNVSSRRACVWPGCWMRRWPRLLCRAEREGPNR
jgi:hypothetical protein